MREIECILLLEDNEADQYIIRKLLKKAGSKIDIIVCDEISDYKLKIKKYSPDVILADFNVPGFNSYDAIQISRRYNSFTPFIFVTGSVNIITAKDTVISAADAYVLKDNIKALPEVLHSLWKRSINYQKMQIEYLKLHELSNRFDNMINKLKPLIDTDKQNN
ncbi:response regulator [Chondrinema litorale]|uniref:response regulator n=1 Tax=Chondrinema litorale TaxID=2994555 RepID=UPI0025432869|nr:response regulator [Chondrinema litorale]UZR98281.1 response regulator [Chondrinema litorale]